MRLDSLKLNLSSLILVGLLMGGGWIGSCGPATTGDEATSELGSQEGGQGGESTANVETLTEAQPKETSGEPTIDAVTDASVIEPDPPEGTPESSQCNVPMDAFRAEGNVRTQTGWVKGSKEGATWSYKGIPYAAGPLGALRWKPPSAHACWTNLRESTQFGDVCTQIETALNGQKSIVGSEDCLSLNVWTPAGAKSPLPVMVFIHGGAHIQGSSSQTVSARGKPLYNGQYLAENEGVVVVTINYRLGSFGYFAHPALSAESSQKVSGNYGVQDQIFALKWIQANIQAFGGDPNKVMIFGESAGAVSTCILVASPLAKGLFHAALMQSGLCNLSQTLTAAEQRGQQVVAQTSCKDAPDPLSCLRNIDNKTLMNEMPVGTGFGTVGGGNPLEQYSPVVDGHVLPQSPFQMIKDGKHNDVPFVLGSNLEEMSGIVLTPVPTADVYEALVRSAFKNSPKDQVDALLKEYDVTKYPKPVDAMADLLTDVQFTCPTLLMAATASKTQTSKVWRYMFGQRVQTRAGELPARHGIELFFVFQSFVDIPGFSPAAEELKLSQQIMRLWAQFAKSGVPSDSQNEVPEWTSYDGAKDNTMLLQVSPTMKNGVRNDRCKLVLPLLGFSAP